MRTYTVHLPRDAKPGDPRALERAFLVRDGFNWAAFFFSVLWMLWHRLWLAAPGAVVGGGAVWRALEGLESGEGAAALASLLLAVLIGLEASSLRRWTYARRGMPVTDVVAAQTHDAADALACARFMERARMPPPPPPPAVVPPPPPPPPERWQRPERGDEIAPFGFAPEGAR
ncbi:MAG: DUF2628 domain-containing protein [Salinarimonas sp.]